MEGKSGFGDPWLGKASDQNISKPAAQSKPSLAKDVKRGFKVFPKRIVR